MYTAGITDADYIAPVFGILLVMAYGADCLRVPYFRVIKAAGHFKETQNGAFIAAGLNTVITVILVFKFGLIGAAIGTLIAMLYHTCYFAWYLRKNILERPLKYFAKHIVTDFVVALASFWIAKMFVMSEVSYLMWIIYAVKVSLIVIVISGIVNLIVYRKQMRNTVALLKRR